MKKISFITFCLLFGIIGVQAQKLTQGSLDFLKNEQELHVVFDYSKVVFTFENGKKSEQAYVKDRVKDEGEKGKVNWETLRDNIKTGRFYDDFVAEMNKKLSDARRKLKAGDYSEAAYVATVKFTEVCAGHNAGPFSDKPYIVAEVIFTKAGSKNVLAIVSFKKTTGNPLTGIDGRFESVYENLGEELGDAIAKKIK